MLMFEVLLVEWLWRLPCTLKVDSSILGENGGSPVVSG
jgi:hypothetical protein